APFTTLRFLLTAKPDIVIVNSPDLWIVTIVGRILFGYVLLADVRENYKLNVLKTEVWPKMLRLPLALYIRATEKLCYFFCSGFILAEKVYTQQLPFVTNSGKPVVIAENKVPKGIISDFKARKTPVLPPSGVIRLLYTGTIALHYGIFEAIDLACALHAINPEISLTIAGYCADKQLFEQLKARLLPCPFITLIGGEKPVSHQILLKLMTEAHFGLLPYRSSPATAGKIPTKLYEYQAFTLPMIIQRNKDWESISNAAEAGIMIDYTNFDAQDILDVLTTRLFYTKGVPNEIWWEEEIPALVSMLAGFYKNKN
ncbi:MAG: glycosyltransferase, partial [Bacteroidota bacterium]